MKTIPLIFVWLVLALACSAAVKAQADSDINDLFGDKEEANVIVLLKDDYNLSQDYGITGYNYQNNLEIRKLMISQLQQYCWLWNS